MTSRLERLTFQPFSGRDPNKPRCPGWTLDKSELSLTQKTFGKVKYNVNSLFPKTFNVNILTKKKDILHLNVEKNTPWQMDDPNFFNFQLPGEFSGRAQESPKMSHKKSGG